MLGDTGYGLGPWTNALTPKGGGETVEITGKYLHIVKTQPDGSLKISRHCWNTDQPLPEMGD